ncbi:MAG: enoyl-CoA hydratase-related protein [Myxococcota bacterium]
MSLVRLDLTERVAWITLDRPPVNVLNIEMLRELGSVLDEVAKNEEASVAVIGAAAGAKAFCAGVDVADHTPDKLASMLEVFHSALKKLARLPQATVAALQGAALGGGLEVALVCDIAIASTRAKLGQPEIRLACFPPVALAALPKISGRVATADIILTGDAVDAQRAKEIGLVSRVLPAEEFDSALREVVAGLAERSPSVLRLTTSLLRRQWVDDFEEALGLAERCYLDDLAQQPDMAEGIAAFMEKRQPVWAS